MKTTWRKRTKRGLVHCLVDGKRICGNGPASVHDGILPEKRDDKCGNCLHNLRKMRETREQKRIEADLAEAVQEVIEARQERRRLKTIEQFLFEMREGKHG